MKLKGAIIAILAVGFVLSGASVTQVENFEDSDLSKRKVTITADHGLDASGYSFSFSPAHRIQNSLLTVVNSDGVFVKQYAGTELYGIKNDYLQIGKNLFLQVKEIKSDQDEIKANLWYKEADLSNSDLNITAPNYIVKRDGEDFTIPLKIENMGAVEEIYELKGESNNSISTFFRYNGYNITKLEVDPGEEKEIRSEISIEDEISNGMYNINFSISDQSFSSENFRFQVINQTENTRKLEMLLEKSYMEKNSGKTFTANFRVDNTGEDKVEDVEPEVSMPENWNYTLTPEEAEEIGEGEFANFEAKISVPSTTTSGDYFVDIGLKNTEDFDGKNIRVNISSGSSGLGIIGLLLAVFAVVLVAGVYKVFGRR